MDNGNEKAGYGVTYEPDGVYVSLHGGAGWSVQPQLVIFDLNRRGITGVSIADIAVRLRNGEGCIKAAPPQSEKHCPFSAYISVTDGGMRAAMQLLPSVGSGEKASLFGVMKQLNAGGVTHGIDNEAIVGAIAQNKYYEPVEVARGCEPVKGEDARLEFLFKTRHDRAPALLEDGSVDFKNLTIFSSVKKGDTLIRLHSAKEGTPGFNVRGEALPARRGAETKMPPGVNCEVSADGMTMTALCDGRVDFANGKVVVSDKFEIRGDVDMSVGNVEFQGDIIIYGGIISGLSVRTTGNIEVYGVVEAAHLQAGGDIVLKKGVQGMDKGIIEAEGSLYSVFIERCSVSVKGSVICDYITNSDVTAGGAVVAKGRYGRIIGGVVRAGDAVTAKVIGTPTGERTCIEVQSMAELRNELESLNGQATQLKEQLERVAATVRAHAYAKNDDPERQAIWERLLNGREQLQEQYAAVTRRIDEITGVIERSPGGKVHALTEAHRDVRLLIDGLPYNVMDILKYATFKCKTGSVIFTSCEA